MLLERTMDLTVLGCSGSYGSPAGGACSGYLLRSGRTALWIDCGNGTFANLQQHVAVEDLDGVVITHGHPDHAVDIYGLHVLLRYGLDRTGLPVFTPEGLEPELRHLVRDWGDTFDWLEVGDGDRTTLGDVELGFSRTDHPPPTVAVEVTGDGKRLVYTADTGTDWSVGAFATGADLVLSEATYQHATKPAPIHLSAREAGDAAREAGARKLMLTHLWPRLDPVFSVAEGAEAFGHDVMLAAPHMRVTI
jgi:ribonuclease BN (tRNA processing enzyme)